MTKKLYTYKIRMFAKKFKFEYTSLVYGSVPEWLMGADCKSADFVYVGSNPTRPNYKFFLPLWLSGRASPW